MLEIDRASKHFGTTRALDDVSLSIPDGQMVGIIGRSGAGKSTMLRLINRLIDPDSGQIRHGSVVATRLRGRQLLTWRARCAMIFQQFNLVGRLDVMTNVLIGRVGYKSTPAVLFKQFNADDRAHAVLALERLGLLDQALQRADTLSGGQQQRVAIARALVQEPKIILADEPIASLDPANAQRVMESLRQINREDGLTVLCNLHHIDVAREFCDRVVGMVSGKVVFDGPVADLDAATIEQIYGQDMPDPVLADKPVNARPAPIHPAPEAALA